MHEPAGPTLPQLRTVRRWLAAQLALVDRLIATREAEEEPRWWAVEKRWHVSGTLPPATVHAPGCFTVDLRMPRVSPAEGRAMIQRGEADGCGGCGTSP
ncbi:hypothetical protein AQ490_05670 [Wenjunlia vitaminophila]|uniref:Uncharacterized protein n=1 Tax=Wenjunlia vitaminophila TaxID=76728 RepID=A0A0T6LPD3_WENVI|nr:hypothetical protein [Wenjunlia vitaminophila]KRV47848.1 hypothetical protein AQ490_05670 [Wenjunlia vitaminophila]